MCPRSSRTGIVSLNWPDPVSRSTSVTGSLDPRWAQNSLMPPSKQNSVCRGLSGSASPTASSRMLMVRPGTRQAVCLARSVSASKLNLASLRKTCRSGQNLILVPVAFFASPVLGRPSGRSPARLVKSASGPGAPNSPVTPRRKLAAQVCPPRSTSTSSRAASALTTEAPTPCSPPEAVYEPPPNLPPPCSRVLTSSTPVSLVLRSTSTGMPRPLSLTSAELSAYSSTSIREQYPPSASSTSLSMISHRQCCSPRPSVDPTYMPGRLRTASRPSRTDRCRAV